MHGREKPWDDALTVLIDGKLGHTCSVDRRLPFFPGTMLRED